jgi:hypothetical protein
MHHRRERTEQILAQLMAKQGKIDVYDDVYVGSNYLEAVQDGKIKPHDVVVQVSLDGARSFSETKSQIVGCTFMSSMIFLPIFAI